MLSRHCRLGDGLLHGGAPSASAGSGRKSSKLNQRFSSLRGSCRSRHQPQAGSVQAASLSQRTRRPVSGNWWRTQGRHHRVAAGHREPRQRVGEWPARVPLRPPRPPVRGSRRPSRQAGAPSPRGPRRPWGDAAPRISAKRSSRALSTPPNSGRGQPVPGRKQVGLHSAQWLSAGRRRAH